LIQRSLRSKRLEGCCPICGLMVRDAREGAPLTMRSEILERLFGVRILAGLNQLEAPLDLAEQSCEIIALLLRKAGQDRMLPVQQARKQLLVELAPLRGQLQPEFAPVCRIRDAFDELSPQQGGDRAADGRFMGPGAL